MSRFILSVILLIIVSSQAISQSIDSAVTRTFANKMKDSLSLTRGQADSIFRIFRASRIEKRQVWSQYRASGDLQKRMLQEDNRRDSLIKTIIGDEKYTLYMQRRWHFLTSN